MEIEVTCDVLMDQYQSPEGIASGSDHPALVSTGANMSEYGYTKIGTAVARVTLHSQDQIVQAQISAAKQELARVRAENQQRENVILDRLSKLQALTFEPA